MKTTALPIKFNNFSSLLEHFTQNDPSAPALVYEKDGAAVKISRADFAADVLEISRELRSFGKTCMGVLCDGSLPCVETIFASAVTGMQTVLLDENAADTLLQEQIRQTDIDILWSSDPDLVDELTPYLTQGIPLGADNGISTGESSDILFFTSGTTASSKAVVLTDQSLLAAAYNGSCMLPLSPDDTLMCMLPLNHVFGFVCGLLWGMECGTAVALGRGARYYTGDFEFYKPTVLSAVPLLLSFLVQHKLMNSELRLVLVGAGDCSARLLNSVVQQGVDVSFGYGLTETSSGVAISVPGRPSFDPFALEICPEDTVALASDGEILISSPSCMMKGYYKHPEDTAAVLKGKKKRSLYSPTAPRSFFPNTRRAFPPAFPDGISPFLKETESRPFCSSTRSRLHGLKRCVCCRGPWYWKNCAASCRNFRVDNSSVRSFSPTSRFPAPRPAK